MLTNHHVIEKAADIRVTLNDGRKLKAELLGSDPETDIALLQIPAEDITAIPLGDSRQLRVGDRFTLGIIRDDSQKSLTARIADPFEDFVEGKKISRQFRGTLLGEVVDESSLGTNQRIAVGPVEEDSSAWQSGLREGDVLFQINRSRVETLEQLREAVEDKIYRIKLRRGKRLVALVSR